MKKMNRVVGCLASIVLSVISCSREDLKTGSLGTGLENLIEVNLRRSVISFDEDRSPDTLDVFYSTKESGAVEISVEGGEEYVTKEITVDKSRSCARIVFTPSTDAYFSTQAAIIARQGVRSARKNITLIREDFRFEDGTTSKSFSFLEYERYFELKLSKADSSAFASIPEECRDWVKSKTETVRLNGREETYLCFLISENNGEREREAHITIEKENSGRELTLNISQIASSMDGSLRAALESFYESLNGESWNHHDNWCSDRPLLEWYGIMAANTVNKECMGEKGNAYFGTEDVWSINLAANNMRGEIPMEFWKICHCFNIIRISSEYLPSSTVPECVWHEGLYSLDLSLSHMNVPLTSAIGKATALHSLSLQRCSVNGEIPQEITSLKELRTLNLRESNLKGRMPSSIGDLENLRICLLDINPDLGGTLPESFYRLENLVEFDISMTQIGGTLSSEVAALKNLESFYITGCEFEGDIPEEIGALDNIIGYDFEGNYFTAIPEFVRYVGYNCRRGGQYTGYGEWVGSAGFPVGIPFHQRNKEDGRPDGYIVKVPEIVENYDIIVDGNPMKMDGYYVDFAKCHHLTFPVWANVKYGLYTWERGYIDEMKYPEYPYADDLQYPASEYYYDGAAWRHPLLEYPAREYYFDGQAWVHDASCPWEKEYVND